MRVPINTAPLRAQDAAATTPCRGRGSLPECARRHTVISAIFLSRLEIDKAPSSSPFGGGDWLSGERANGVGDTRVWGD